jgi:hypothetical protein
VALGGIFSVPQVRYSFQNRPYQAKGNDARAETTLRVSYPSKER